MDTVILAAGENKRLKGLVPSGMKPLLVINGRPLIVNAVGVSLQHSDRIIIVASPSNVQPICQLLEDNHMLNGKTFVIVQPKAGGPGDALLYGMELCASTQTMVLCADNILHENDVAKVVADAKDKEVVIGGRRIFNSTEARRFTLVGESGRISEGQGTDGSRWSDGSWHVWLGPLVVPTQPMRDTLRQHSGDEGELKIGSHLDELDALVGWREVDSYDVGTIEALNGSNS